MNMKKTLLAMALAFSASSAQAVLMTELLGGGSITAGDKLFDRWTQVFYDSSDGRTFNPDNIDVNAIDDGGDFGLRFEVLNGELSITGDDIYAYVDLSFGFRVSVPDPSMKITGASLGFAFGGAFLSWVPDKSNDSGSFILESVGTGAALDDLATMDVEFSVLDDVETSDLSDAATFSPQNETWVTKNILVWATDSTDSAGLSNFDQRFSQTAVPEPATLALLGLGFAGLAAARRRKTV